VTADAAQARRTAAASPVGNEARDRAASTVPPVDYATDIPRIIHQTYPTKVLPPAFQANVDHLRRLNPGWEYRLYDDADVERFILSACGPEMLATYNSIAPGYGAARADLFRYLVIHREGGVYLDIKSTASLSFDEVLMPGDAFVLAQWDNRAGEEHEGFGLLEYVRHVPGGEFVQWFIAAAPGHPMMAAVVERVVAALRSYNPLRHGTGRAVVRVTGPVPYTEAIAPLLDQYRHRLVRNHRDLGLRYSMVGGMEHRAPAGASHYTRSRHPIVNRPRAPGMRLLIQAVLELKALRRWLLRLG